MVDKNNYEKEDLRIKVIPIRFFYDNLHSWCVDKCWEKEDKIALGIEEEEEMIDFETYKERISELSKKIKDIGLSIKTKFEDLPDSVEEPLSDLFTIGQGDAYYTKKIILGNKWLGDIPVYSSNTKQDGLMISINENQIKPKDKYYSPCLTWAIDGDAGTIFVRNEKNILNLKEKKYLFTINNHCGILIPKKKNIDLHYIKVILEPLFKSKARSYDNKKVGNNQIEDIIIKMPINEKEEYDLKKQKEIADKYEQLELVRKEIKKYVDDILKVNVDLL
jgi:hypothetical protein